jgi:hypothetical protein
VQSNKGFQLLLRMGWQAGKGLGIALQGRSDPIPISNKRDALGIGRMTMEVRMRWFYFYIFFYVLKS